MNTIIIGLILFCCSAVYGIERLGLSAVIVEDEIIEWTTYSKTFDICGMDGGISCAVIHYPMCNQRGNKYLIKFAEIDYKGQIYRIELEKTDIDDGEILDRSVICDYENLSEIILH